MTLLFVFVLVVLFMIGGYMVNGWALLYLWKWFMVPLGLPVLTIPWAIGISIVIGFLTNHNIPQKEDSTDSGKALAYVFLRPLMALFVGYIVKFYL